MRNNAKRILLICTLCFAVVTAVFAAPYTEPSYAAEGDYSDSGSRSLEKLSKEEIIKLIEDTEAKLGKDVFSEAPSVVPPYSTGKVKEEILERLSARLNAARRIAGLPGAELSSDLSLSAQYGAVLNAANGKISHSPERPQGMDDLFYNLGAEADSTSNLYRGKGTDYIESIFGFMDDSDSSNVDRLGHRRWQLNPALGKVGFGLSESEDGGIYLNEKVFDRGGTTKDYDFIAWPASGCFPSSIFNSDTAWSVSLNPEIWQNPDINSVTVKLTRADGKSWSLGKSDASSSPSTESKYFNVNLGGYGIANAIIFRPPSAEIGVYDGLYTVEMSGLKSKSGSAASLKYQVDFFGDGGAAGTVANVTGIGSTGGTGTGSTAEDGAGGNANGGKLPFTDVPAGAYYEEAVGWAYRSGITTGTSATEFLPSSACTRGQVCTFLWRAKGKPAADTLAVFSDVTSDKYYYVPVRWAYGVGVTDGTGEGLFSPEKICTEGEILTFIWRAEWWPEPSEYGALSASYPDSAFYKKAVAWAEEKGMLSGFEGGFDPKSPCPREHIVSYLYRAFGGKQ